MSATPVIHRISNHQLDLILFSGLLCEALQFVQIGPAQPGQLWAIAVVGWLAWRGELRVRAVEIYFYLLFIGMAVFLTAFADYDHVKAAEQIAKFAVLYPAFYLIGRTLGERYRDQPLPYGYVVVCIFLAFEYAIQYFNVPIIYQEVGFAQGTLHGSFRERNWIAIYVFFITYFLLLKSPIARRDILLFVGVNLLLTWLTGSKTVLVAVGIVLLFQIRGQLLSKTIFLIVGSVLYIQFFGQELSGDLLRVRIEEERGFALTESVKLIADNWLGYGFGYVEAYFSKFFFIIKGVGAGTNSIFSVPLDLMIIAGVPGLIFWLVFFCGVGLRSVLLLAPIAAWSLLNPLHQSDIVYLFNGVFVSWGLTQYMYRLKPASAIFPETFSPSLVRAGGGQ